jgi:hypothetical protein
MAPRFEELIERHHDEICAYLWRLMGPDGRQDGGVDVEDLTQDVFSGAAAEQQSSSVALQNCDPFGIHAIASNQTSARQAIVLGALANGTIEGKRRPGLR